MCSRLTASVLVVCLVSAAADGQNKKTNEELVKWRALKPRIQAVFADSQRLCEPYSVGGGAVDAADFAGSSIAVVDICPMGASTDLLEVMRLEGSEPVVVRFRKNGRAVTPTLLSGASAMHADDVKLVPGKLAIHIIHCQDGIDKGPTSTFTYESCRTDAYVWNAKNSTFDFNRKLSHEANRREGHQSH